MCLAYFYVTVLSEIKKEDMKIQRMTECFQLEPFYFMKMERFYVFHFSTDKIFKVV